MTDTWQSAYPSRYYVGYDTKAAQPTSVTARYDMAVYGNLTGLPPASDLVALTADQWAALPTNGIGVKNGSIVPYTAPVAAVPLKMQAQRAQAWINQQIATSFALGTPFTEDMKTYVAQVTAIADGTDTTSTALPAQPTNIMT